MRKRTPLLRNIPSLVTIRMVLSTNKCAGKVVFLGMYIHEGVFHVLTQPAERVGASSFRRSVQVSLAKTNRYVDILLLFV